MTIQAENENITIDNEEQPEQLAEDIVEQAVLHPDELELTQALEADEAEQAAIKKAADDAEAARVAEEAKKAPVGEGDKPKPSDPAKTEVPLAALIATRKKGHEAEIKVAERDARLQILAEHADILSPEQIRAIAAGKQTVEQATTENEQDPYDLLDARELEIEKQRQDGDLDAVDYRAGMQAIAKEKRALDRQVHATTTVVERNQQVTQGITAHSKAIAADFPDVFSADGKCKLGGEVLEACKPIAERVTLAGMEAQFGAGVQYDNLNPQHRLFFQWNLANTVNKNYGDGKGPLSSQAKKEVIPPKLGPDGKPIALAIVKQSPAAKAAALQVSARVRDASPPDLSQFAFSAETDLGQAERLIETGTDEQVLATLAKYPELRAKLEGRT